MLLALSPTVVHSSTALQAQLQASVSGCSSVGIAMKCDYDLEFKSLLHAYGDVKEPSKACVGCVLGLVRKYVAEVITLASRRSVKRDNNLPLASEIAKASAEYSSRFMHFKLHSNSTDGWSAMQAVAAHEQTDKRLVERVGLIERRLAEGTEEQKAHLIACVGVSLVTHKRDRFRRFVGLKALAGKALELVGFIAQQRAAAIITEALRSQCSYDRYSSKAALEPLEFDEKLTLDELVYRLEHGELCSQELLDLGAPQACFALIAQRCYPTVREAAVRLLTQIAKGSTAHALQLVRGGVIPLAVSYTHLRAHETVLDLVCRLLLDTKLLTII
eukprot:TRINITY_DN5624_c0_g1_i2.p1 TRINITY_DN5624_c0_g1~~TRINITY_DN5624_c0_g1_i2.p1  ORF type:complete len:331 (+),score=88.72 TRINITY_DN5624_c0_g1_i2:276-1268(+)